jgi:hypothetical protein
VRLSDEPSAADALRDNPFAALAVLKKPTSTGGTRH